MQRVLVVDEHGEKLGQFLTEDALRLATERGLDLIEVAPDADPPVCRISDWGKLKYERKKKAADAKKRQHQNTVKELKVRPKTDEHDMNVKIRKAIDFLRSGDKVRITVRFRGREHAHHDIGVEQCQKIADACAEVGVIEVRPQMEGRQMFMVLSPVGGS